MRGIRKLLKEHHLVSYFSRNRRWLPLTVAILMSAFLWLIIALSAPSGYVKQVRIEVIPPDIPPGYIITDTVDFPSELTVNIHANGGVLFRYSLQHLFDDDLTFKPVIDTLLLNPEGGEWRLTMQELKDQLLAQSLPGLRRSISDIGQSLVISPSEIALTLMPLMEQPIEVVFGSQVDYGNRANLRLVDSVEIVPSVVQIYGSKDRLSELNESQIFVMTDTTAIKLSSAGQTSHRVALLAPYGTKLYPDSVTVVLTTEELLHYTKEVKSIEITNLPKGYSIKLLPETVKITYLIPKILGTDDPNLNIRLYVDAADVLSTNKKYLDVKVRDVPESVEMIQLVPDRLEFILTENKKP